MKKVILYSILICTGIYAKTAVLPPVGVNTDDSFLNAFGTILANKYRKVSGLEVLPPRKTAKSIGEDSSLTDAAARLGADEYIEVEAVGLYISRKEKMEVYDSDNKNGKQPIIVKIDHPEKYQTTDQELLDNHKTIVTVTRRNASGEEIHLVEMTLLTYGDIEESTDRIAKALYRKVSVEDVKELDNITRKEGIHKNKTFTESLKGVKFGVFYAIPLGKDFNLPNIVHIGYNQRLEADKYFLEFGINAKLPTEFEGDYTYGGVQPELGFSYFVVPSVVGVYVGVGVAPLINIGDPGGIGVGLMPYLQGGVTFPRTGSVRGFAQLRIGQNALEITTGSYDYYDDNVEYSCYPMEIGVEFGILF